MTTEVCGKDRVGEGRTEESKTTLKSALGGWVKVVPVTETGHIGGRVEQMYAASNDCRFCVLRFRCWPVIQLEFFMRKCRSSSEGSQRLRSFGKEICN